MPDRERIPPEWRPDVYLVDDAELEKRCDELVAAGRAFAGRFGGSLHGGSLYESDPGTVAAALDELAELYAVAAWLDGTTSAALAVAAGEAAARDRRARVESALAELDSEVQFVELEWLALPEPVRHALAADERLRRHRNYLAVVASTAPYTLPAAAEAALAARDHAAEAAWVGLYRQVVRELVVVVDGRPQPLEQARRLLEHADAGARSGGLECIYDALEPVAGTLATCLDTLVADRVEVAGLRGLPGPRAERDLTNELPGAAVDGMLDLVERNYGIARRWIGRKAALLGQPRPRFADLRAPAGPAIEVPYGAAVSVALRTFDRLGPEAGALARELLAAGRVDAAPRTGKDPGAFCRSLGPQRLPCVLLSYFGTVEDAVCLVHELAHGVHYAMAGRHNGALSATPPLAMTEVAPALAELLAYDEIIGREADPARRRVLAARRMDGAFETVFFSTFLTRLEEALHELRAAGTVLTGERLREQWDEHGRRLFGQRAEVPRRWGLHWMLVPHLFHERFYPYTYVFARLVALQLYAAYRTDPTTLPARLPELLAAGGSASPAEQLANLGIDLTDPACWQHGIDELAVLADIG